MTNPQSPPPADVPTESRYVTAREAAGMFSVSTDTILRWIKGGHLPAYRTPTGRLRLVRTEIQAAAHRAGWSS